MQFNVLMSHNYPALHAYPSSAAISEGGDVERLEIPKEAKEEIKQSHGQVFEMSKEPAW